MSKQDIRKVFLAVGKQDVVTAGIGKFEEAGALGGGQRVGADVRAGNGSSVDAP